MALTFQASPSLLGDVIQLSTELGHSFSQVLTAVATLQRFLSRSDVTDVTPQTARTPHPNASEQSYQDKIR